MLRPSPMPIWATVSPTAVSTAHTPPLAVTTTLESVTPRPSPMPIWATVSHTAVSTAHTPPLAVTTTLESVTPRPSPMPGAMVSPLPTEVSTAHTPPMAVTTSESAMPRLSPGATTEELLSSGLNCNTIKNLPRRIIQLPVLWIPKKLKVQNEYLLHIA